MIKNGKRIKAIITGGALIGALVYASVGESAVYRCDTCSAGTYSDGTLTSCQSCPAGTYSHTGASSCTKCPAGKYQPNSGQSSCLTCGSNIEYCDYTYSYKEKNCKCAYYITCMAVNPAPFNLGICSCCRETKYATKAGHQTVYYTSNSARTACVVSSRDTCLEGVYDPK